MTLRYLSVCSGIEAASVAWHPLGWEPVAFAEIEAFPAAVLAHHYPSVPNWGDLTRYKEWPDAAFDVLVGGTPCQSFSVAGLREGLNDPRGNLMLTFAAVARRYRPDWVVWENVPGVLSSDEGRDFAAFGSLMAECGYYGAWRVLDAQYLGVAQRRRRVFFVGHARDWRRAAAVLLEPESMRGDPAPSRETREGIAPTISARTKGGGGLGTDFDLDGGLIAYGGNNTSGPIDVAAGLNAKSTMRSDFETETFVFDRTQITHPENRSNQQPGDPCHTLAKGAQPPTIALSCKDYGADAGELSPTLRSMNDSDSNANGGGQVAVAFQTSQSGVRVAAAHPTLDSHNGSRRHHGALVEMQVRRLTPRECERLQGFPDDYTLIPHRGKPAADGPRYKALGNSMAVPVMRWIGERIATVHAATEREKAAA